jgi:hypothetical protein
MAGAVTCTVTIGRIRRSGNPRLSGQQSGVAGKKYIEVPCVPRRAHQVCPSESQLRKQVHFFQRKKSCLITYRGKPPPLGGVCYCETRKSSLSRGTSLAKNRFVYCLRAALYRITDIALPIRHVAVELETSQATGAQILDPIPFG